MFVYIAILKEFEVVGGGEADDGEIAGEHREEFPHTVEQHRGAEDSGFQEDLQ